MFFLYNFFVYHKQTCPIIFNYVFLSVLHFTLHEKENIKFDNGFLGKKKIWRNFTANIDDHFLKENNFFEK
jgi:hypothetical protein